MEPAQDQIPSTVHKTSTPQCPLLEIQREFNVPVDRLFQAFTSSEALKAWWWPKGLYSDQMEWDFHEGGHYFINMKGFDRDGGMTGDFEEIVQNRRIVMTDQFADVNGNVVSSKDAQIPGEWPEVLYDTFEFESAGENRSRLRLSQEGVPDEMQSECRQGWNESFDKLENYLSSRNQ